MPITFDGRTGMSLTWNDLGLVEKVSLGDTVLVNYAYLADGTKVSALDAEGDGYLYLGSLIYKKQGENISLESAGFAGGRFVAKESGMVPMFHVTDHLGSVRAVVDGVSGEVVETNDYYPFGSRWNTATNLTDQTNRFRYNSKEEQLRFGTPYIDYGARQYDPVLGRWFAQDPLLEKYYGISPYAFCAGNPVKYLDPNGEDPRLYIQKSGLGHVFVTTGEGGNTIVYSYGRYGALYETSGSTSGGFTPTGEGVLVKYSGEDAAGFLSKVKTEGNMEIYHISSGSDEKTALHFDTMFEGGIPPSNPVKESFNSPNAKVINTYSLLKNNCVTTSVDGVNVDAKIVESNAISPKGLAKDLNKQANNTQHIVKIEDPIDFISNLLKLMKYE